VDQPLNLAAFEGCEQEPRQQLFDQCFLYADDLRLPVLSIELMIYYKYVDLGVVPLGGSSTRMFLYTPSPLMIRAAPELSR
jgi:hypothetical protein